MRQKKSRLSLLLAALVAIFTVASCESNMNDDLAPGGDTGKLTVRMTDAPLNIDLVEEANVTITRIEARQVVEESEADTSNPFITLYNETETYNLLELRNGVTETLVDMEIPTGDYDLIRLYVDEASLTLTNGETYDVKVPSGQTTGIKVFIDPELQVEGGLTSELLLDFDVSKSFVMKGNLNTPAGVKGFNFKPVIRAVNETTAGRIDGMVTDTSEAALNEAAVWIEKDTVITTTYSDTTGSYAILGVKEGTYDLYAAKEGYDTLKVSGVEVTAGNKTTQNFELMPT
ncbi:MAG TPA: DUF4382 domain-containing protein, partial [Bacteroidales bacterium]|nr:DUF4382 domain-containing protein [Bacteroidales bacterium]